MKPKRFVHVGFNFEGEAPPVKQLEATFNKATDWLRYGSQNWVLYTGLELDEWRDRIRGTKGIRDKDIGFFLVEFEYGSGISGYMTNSEWKWFTKKRS